MDSHSVAQCAFDCATASIETTAKGRDVALVVSALVNPLEMFTTSAAAPIFNAPPTFNVWEPLLRPLDRAASAASLFQLMLGEWIAQ